MIRNDVEFESSGTTCRAWWYRPDGSAPAPVIVMAHGLGGVRQMRLDAFAERFTEAGYSCLVFDYRHFGDSDGEPRQLLSIRRQLDDWAAAIAFARRLDGVDSSRIVLWGTSFGGGHVLVAGRRDGRVAAVISQCPFTSGIASTAALGVVSGAKVTVRALADIVGSAFGRPPVTVGLAGEPRTAALMTAPDAVSGYLPLIPEGLELPNQVAARVGLTIPLHSPGRALKDLDCPTLLCVCDGDTVAPARPTVKYARRAPRARVIRYPVGHFDIYIGDDFEQVVGDQLEFLRATVPV
ncbi:alpha/beta hydrolase [Gordonia sp. KTR9]|uniref:alpha/beta hydrolase n=1 Tax=Gordonia sp. KTR9 TaxID=337191 RepID=UPI00027DDB93|nr:alpha/beta fold hydrolase [Gordonia sp. KTR9]AFR47625.1 dienelactone hydrolase [Gordonia sp. KTR9]